MLPFFFLSIKRHFRRTRNIHTQRLTILNAKKRGLKSVGWEVPSGLHPTARILLWAEGQIYPQQRFRSWGRGRTLRAWSASGRLPGADTRPAASVAESPSSQDTATHSPAFSFLRYQSRACPARRLEKDTSSFPYGKARESLAVKRTNRTCLVACHFNDNTNLSQVSIPHTPPLPPAPGGGGRWAGSGVTPAGAGEKHENKLHAFREPRGLMTNI